MIKFFKKILKITPDFTQKIQQFLKEHVGHQKSNKTILFWEVGGFPLILEKNAIISLALNARNFKTHFILCDGTSGACMQKTCHNENLDPSCQDCWDALKYSSQKYQCEYSGCGSFIDEETKNAFKMISQELTIKECFNYMSHGVTVGELAWSSTNRFFQGVLYDISSLTKQEEIVYRKYFLAALINTHVAVKAIEKFKPAALFTSHGVYADYAPAVFVAMNYNIPVTTWTSGFQEYYHYFTRPKKMNVLEIRGIDEKEWQRRIKQPLLQSDELRLNKFLKDRYFRGKSRDVTNEQPQRSGLNELKKMLKIENSNPIVCLFTHLNWDACFDLSTMLFETANQWVVESINKMIEIKHVNWIVKVHPSLTIDGEKVATNIV